MLWRLYLAWWKLDDVHSNLCGHLLSHVYNVKWGDYLYIVRVKVLRISLLRRWKVQCCGFLLLLGLPRGSVFLGRGGFLLVLCLRKLRGFWRGIYMPVMLGRDVLVSWSFCLHGLFRRKVQRGRRDYVCRVQHGVLLRILGGNMSVVRGRNLRRHQGNG